MIIYDLETKQFSVVDESREFAHKRNKRGYGRAFLVGGVGGVAGMLGTGDYIKRLEAEGVSEAEIKKRVGKRAAKRGAITNAVLAVPGMMLSPKSAPTQIAGIGAGALGGYLGARKNYRKGKE